MTVPLRRNGGLGRGLGALIPQRPSAEVGASDLPISLISPNPYQPRQRLSEEDLEQLAASIAEHGVIQPILVTETLDGYQLIAGERRLRAAQRAGLERIPALVRQVAGREQLELALVENVQRADLNALEEAHAYRQLAQEFGLSHEEIARRVGRSRPAVTNTIRLLELPPEVQQALVDGALSEGHARALGGLERTEQQRELLALVVARGLSVRQTEELARRLKETAGPGRLGPVADAPRGDPDLERLETELRDALGTKVTLTRSRHGGRIVIEYYDASDLDRLYGRLVGATE